MKKNLVIVALGIICAACLIKLNAQSKELQIYYGNEMPGIGADKSSPDICTAYWDKEKDAVVVSYLPSVRSIDWPEEMPIATNGDKFTAELKDGVLHVGFDNSIKETFKR